MANELVTVFAFDKGTIRYRGIRWSVTLRAVVLENGACVEGDIQQARVFMDAMIEAAANGLFEFDPSCLICDPIDQRPADEQPRQPQSDSGREGEHCISIAKLMGEDGESVTYRLTYNLSNGKLSKFPMNITKASEVVLLETALGAAGYNVSKIPFKTAFPIEINVSWVKGKTMPNQEDVAEAKRKHFRDGYRFEILTKKATK